MLGSRLDTPGIARTLAQVADRPDDIADAYFERLEVMETSADGAQPGARVRREEGFAVRLVREGRAWMASRDVVSPESFRQAVRQIARAVPATPHPSPELELSDWEPLAPDPTLREFPESLNRAIRSAHAAFPVKLTLRRHRRWVQVIGTRLAAEPQRESFFSCLAEHPWGRCGALFWRLDEEAAEQLARSLVGRFRARDAATPGHHRGTVILGPAAVAVFAHEAVAHALEVDTHSPGGSRLHPGLQLGSKKLHVLDDPGAAPEPIRRSADDEAVPVIRRWLLRAGRVEQPLAHLAAAHRSTQLTAGAARRSSRHLPPVPRSTFLDLPPGDAEDGRLLAGAEEGLLLPEASRGRLDPSSSRFELELPYARRIRGGEPAEYVGPCVLRGAVGELLSAVVEVGDGVEMAGAGWCAKDGQRLPVWARAPSLRLEGVEVEG